MRGLLRTLIAAIVAFTLTGGSSLALAMTSDPAAHAQCPKPAPDCHETALKCACCMEDGSGVPAPAPPSQDRTSFAKPPVSPATFVSLPPIVSVASLACGPHALSTHRPGPPLSLSILHASLLL